MTLRIFALAAALGLATVAHAAPQAATAPAAKGMNYDCTKPGNKNKAACKNVTPAAVAAPAKPMAAAKPMASNRMAAVPASPAKPMNYDCTKPGNKNKAACKNVVVPPAVAAAKPMAAAPVAMAARTTTAKPMVRTAAVRTANPNEVTATLKNGKVVHYDCSKPGNKDKKACGAK